MFKKVIICFLTFVISSTIVACSSDKVKLISWQSDDINSISTESEISLEFDFDAKNEDAANEKNIDFLGKNFKAQYETSVTSPYADCDYDRYVCKINDIDKYTFGFNSNTGELVKYSYTPLIYVVDSGMEEQSRNNCYQMAVSELNKIDKGYDYILYDEKERNAYEGVYVFKFVRMISGIRTADEIHITIGKYGEIFALQWVAQNSLLGIKEVDYNENEVNLAIDEKIKELYDKNEVQYGVDEQIIVKLKDGTVGLECTLTVDTESEYDDRIKLFVEL